MEVGVDVEREDWGDDGVYIGEEPESLGTEWVVKSDIVGECSILDITTDLTWMQFQIWTKWNDLEWRESWACDAV